MNNQIEPFESWWDGGEAGGEGWANEQELAEVAWNAALRQESDEYQLNGKTELSLWFGLSYASWLTLPRVLMESMPEDWQGAMANLLNKFDAEYPNQPDLGTRVQVTCNGKLVKSPEWLLNYRHPNRAAIAMLRLKSEKEVGCAV